MTSSKISILALLLSFTILVSVAFIWLYLEEKEIQGVVLDATSGEPIPAATLQVGSARIVSNEHGLFSANLDQRDNIFLEANAPGYLPVAFTFDFPWYLRSGRVHVNLAPLGLSFRVVDGWTDTPIENLTFQLGDLVYQTDQSGIVNLDPSSLDPPFLISVNHPGYLPRLMKLARLPLSSTELPLLIKLEPHSLTGFVVTRDTHEPLPEVTVTAGNTTLQADEDGRFFLFRLQPGALISILPDQRFLSTEFLFEGQPTVTIEVPPRQLEVKVSDGFSGLPISNVEVQADGQTALTNDQGQAQLERVPLEGILQINHATYLSQTVSYHMEQPTTVTLIPNFVQGVIRDAGSGQALTHTEVMLDGKPLPLDGYGGYQLTNLDQVLTLSFKQAGYKPARLRLNAANYELTAKNLTLQPCQTDLITSTGLCLDLMLQPFAAKAIYVPFNLLGKPDQISAIFDLIGGTELNAIVLDVKGDQGLLAWDSQVPQADLLNVDGDRDGWMTLETFLDEAQARDIYTIARMVIFKDNPFAFGNTDLAVTYADGHVWLDGAGLGWANPFREEVWGYNIALAEEIAAIGFDEINLDYIRFPSDGNIGAIAFAEENTAETRTTAIRTFMSRMDQAIAPYGAYLSADVFGLTVWVDSQNSMNIGQRVIDIAPYVDYLAPMLYPSTFIPGNLGLADPSAQPYDVIFRSQNAAVERVPTTTKVRPWLQAYWYTTAEMLLQKQAANDANSAGWSWWNAAGIYDEAVFERNEASP